MEFEYWYKAKCVAIYDGDTITCDIDLGFNMIMRGQKIRLYGIDTPEIRGDEREEGLKAKHYLMHHILGEQIVLQTYKDRSGKYGRWLGVVHFNGVNMNEELVQQGYAERYAE